MSWTCSRQEWIFRHARVCLDGGAKVDQIKLLAVGNSFSEDALYYFHDICETAGITCKAVNLYIGGCSLQQHCENIASGKNVYEYQLNGNFEGQMVSVQDALAEDAWDYILIQQASHDSGIWETYEPWLAELAVHIREGCPKAELLLHKTWAYEQDSSHDAFVRYHNSQMEMYQKLTFCYGRAAEQVRVRLIPSADVIQEVRQREGFCYGHGEQSLCRDGYHMHMIYGRYLLGALFYMFLTGRDIRANAFCPEGAETKKIETIKQGIVTVLLQDGSEYRRRV